MSDLNGDTFVFYPTFLQQLKAIKSDSTRLLLYDALAEYGVLGKIPDFTDVDKIGLLDAIFTQFRYCIDEAKAKRKELSEKRSNAGKKGGAKVGNSNASKNKQKQAKTDKTSINVNGNVNDNDNDNIISPNVEIIDQPRVKQGFIVPTLEEIKIYISERGYNIDAECFFNYYQSNGWKVGTNKMKDWKAAIAMWHSRNSSNSSNNTKQTNLLNYASPLGGHGLKE